MSDVFIRGIYYLFKLHIKDNFLKKVSIQSEYHHFVLYNTWDSHDLLLFSRDL